MVLIFRTLNRKPRLSVIFVHQNRLGVSGNHPHVQHSCINSLVPMGTFIIHTVTPTLLDPSLLSSSPPIPKYMHGCKDTHPARGRAGGGGGGGGGGRAVGVSRVNSFTCGWES